MFARTRKLRINVDGSTVGNIGNFELFNKLVVSIRLHLFTQLSLPNIRNQQQ